MCIAILIPLYRPGVRHLLLLKSVLSATNGQRDVTIFVAADGPDSAVSWPLDALEHLVAVAGSMGQSLSIYSFIKSYGYPGCYRALIEDALTIPSVQLVHFIDQDDYCLDNRFEGRSRLVTEASGALVVNARFGMKTIIRFDTDKSVSTLETPAPGMTFSIPRDTAQAYLNLCALSEAAARSPHDFVIAQFARAKGQLRAVPAASMLYVQHETNTIGHFRGLGWFWLKIRTLPAVLGRLRRHVAVLDLLYGGRTWVRTGRLHRRRVFAWIYASLLMYL